ncbi:putative cytosol aminopeptidase [Sinomonas cyclohexanicum]|uniref:Probable cytosol aminopeptidase n=1 Tax=Sinomonas cyclohexanicum TaxID=322009 RepID=A0ABN6FGG6_SINCY|nr:leucyl aminopeptidase [Corynebacterium cyclohexanicum]BCT75975.1 putative cytosol aminopeptidase [Corynebacterium cyclohexanicum]
MFSNSQAALQAVSKDPRKTPSDVLVVGVAQGADGPVLLDNPLTARNAEAVGSTLAALGVTGAADQLHRLPGLPEAGAHVLALAGVGKVDAGASPTAEQLRRAAGSAIRQLAGHATVVLALPAATPEDVAAVAEGAALGSYSYTEHKSDAADTKPNVANVIIHTPAAGTPEADAALARASVLGTAVNATRTLVNMPPSQLYPETADAARELAKGLPVKVTVFDEKRLAKDGFGGILAVGQGSVRPPRMVKVEYVPAKAPAAKSVHLVGKGITFDSGGISIKPAANMDQMKSDMAGAATVLNATLAAARLGLAVKVTAWLCIAENMPSGSAQRPADVITIRGGRTVEVLNTDAEGRLVMADGLAAASEEGPDALIDVATLTGAALIALGTRTAGVMGDDAVTRPLLDAAASAGEAAWPMPLPEELRAGLDSATADIANAGERPGGMLTAAIFLKEFVGTRADGSTVPWAHIDIAGPAFNTGSAYGHTPKQGTGSTVRTLVGYLEDVARA